MDVGQEYYGMFGAQAGERIPFYMTYPMRNSFLEEAEYDRDCRRMQALYPRDARRIQGAVSRECDKMEHEGSLMFDEYPDRLSVRMLAQKIYREVWDDPEAGKLNAENRELFGNCGPGGCRPAGPDRQNPFMQLVEVMLMQEMYRRRCRHLRCRRWY